VPDSPTICGAPAPSSLIVRAPVCGVVFIGAVKVTSTLQFFFGANVLSQVFLTAKGEAVDSPVIVTLIFEFFPLSFVIVTVLGLLIFPCAVLLPKSSEAGEIFSVAPGVAVEVGVAVAITPVGVDVGVADIEPCKAVVDRFGRRAVRHQVERKHGI